MMKEFNKLLDVIKGNPKVEYAMATVVHVQGSAYRKEGAKMLIGTDGSMHGTISAGCLEEDLYYHAIEVLESTLTKIVTYDLKSEDDLGWGQGAGCNGIIDVFIEPFYWSFQLSNYQEIFTQIDKQLSNGKNIISIKRIGQDEPAFTLYYLDDRKIIGNLDNKQYIAVEIEYELQKFKERGVNFEKVKLNQCRNEYLFELIEPKDQLYIFGAGPDAEPLVQLASQLDYSVTVIDPRSDRCSKKYFKNAESLVIEQPKTYLSKTKIPQNSYVIIMTHNFERDREILHHLIDNPLTYLGVLGPRRRTERLIAPYRLPGQVYSPIGLDIRAEGSEEISVSVIAELINVRNSKPLATVKC